MKLLVVLADYIFAFAVVGLFLWLTPFGDGWRYVTLRFFLLSVFVGMSVAQLLFPHDFSRENIDSDRIFRNATCISVTFTITTYLSMRVISSPGTETGRWLVAIGITFLFLFTLFRWLERTVLKKFWASGRNNLRVIAVGNGTYFNKVLERVQENASCGFHIIGCFTDGDAPKGVEVFGTVSDALEVVNLDQSFPGTVDALFCGLTYSDRDTARKLSLYCDKHVLRFFFIPSEDNVLRLRLRPVLIGGDEVFTNLIMPLSVPFNRIVKRTFDVVFSSLVLLVLLPFLPIIAIIIKCQSPGPVFFSQARTGMDGRTFLCYKFRSMHVNKEADTMQATKNDPRKFPFGNFMRKCNIDELPQFFNVLKNDMSIVGPRPHMLKHTQMYSAVLSKYMVRHFVKPGITGWAQVTGFRGETKELWQMEGRVRADIWYIEHWSFWLDMRIIWLTIKSIFIHDKHAY